MDNFERKLVEMKEVYHAIEDQFLEFNQIIPYGHNTEWESIYSPRLVTLLFSIGPQIETMIKSLMEKMNLKPRNDGKNFYDFFNVINERNLLSCHEVGLPVPGYPNKSIMPFEKNSDGDLEWWWAYNQIKHHMPEGMYHGTLRNAINALAALSVLHHVAYSLIVWPDKEDFSKFLDSVEWKTDEESDVIAHHPNENLLPNELPAWWSSKVFFFSTRKYDIA